MIYDPQYVNGKLDLPSKEILEKYNSHPSVTLKQLAKEYNTTSPTIKRRIIEAGGTVKDPNSLKGRKFIPTKKIVEEYLQGMSQADLGKKYGVSYRTIGNRLISQGVRLRTHKEACDLHRNNKKAK